MTTGRLQWPLDFRTAYYANCFLAHQANYSHGVTAPTPHCVPLTQHFVLLDRNSLLLDLVFHYTADVGGAVAGKLGLRVSDQRRSARPLQQLLQLRQLCLRTCHRHGGARE